MTLPEIQEWLNGQDQPARRDVETCAAAAADGRLDVLQFLRAEEPPCAWDASACAAAAYNGHLAVLQWLREQEPPCAYDNSASEAASSQGHVDVIRWLLTQDPPCCTHGPRPSQIHLKTLQAVAECAYTEEFEHIYVPAADHAARQKDQEKTKYLAALDHPALTLRIVMRLIEKRRPCELSFMQNLGCLEFDIEHQDIFGKLLMVPVQMGDAASVKNMTDVIVANDLILDAVCAACKGRIASILPDQAELHSAQLRYWEAFSDRPDFLALVVWLSGLDEAGSQLLQSLKHELQQAEDWLLIVELLHLKAQAMPERKPAILWSAATHRFTAALAALAMLRWLLEQPGLPEDYTTVHPDCTNARMMLLVHGYGWQLPDALAERLEATEKRRLAVHCIATQQHRKAGTACLGHLPHELIKKILCGAGIDFSWGLSDYEHV